MERRNKAADMLLIYAVTFILLGVLASLIKIISLERELSDLKINVSLIDSHTRLIDDENAYQRDLIALNGAWIMEVLNETENKTLW